MPHSDVAPQRPWQGRVLAVAFAGMATYSVYLASTLLRARCESFSCTYLGIAWFFWLGVVFLPAAALGLFAHRSKSLPPVARSLLRLAWHLHTVFAAGLLAWWLLPHS